jgi:hypothetical protein
MDRPESNLGQVYFVDCEFIDLPWTGCSELLWVALAVGPAVADHFV